MARTYLSTLSPRRRWGIAGCAAGTVLLLTAALGNPWTWSTMAGLDGRPVGDRVPVLAKSLSVFHWTLGPHGSSAPAGQTTGHWIAGLVLDLAWPLFVLLGARLLAGGLALRRARLSLLLGVWSLTTLSAAVAGLAAGLVDHAAAPGMRVIALPLAAGAPTGDVLTLQAATMALLGAALGWLPGLTAAVGYSVRRASATQPASSASSSAPSQAGVPVGASAVTETRADTQALDLAGLESLRRARRRSLDGTLPDAATSSFFSAE
ncbi:hypothetical protein KGA66_14955 [Actinocrinis puniceicyclus]|uniref:Uncharacterized protein n=1 Tax=Actinocrinis puniceicyclus TaxID=977794 RepID=A0A8J8BDN7_9ACTN|nr:hypothetical protein [Actinocrinis puniceicyclus]MBS2964356.1 hypothetical protein [Actinocrinis puniceicyclus]